jgi:hypothetical protein
MEKNIDYERLWKEKKEDEKRRQEQWRAKQKKENRTSLTIWVSKSEKEAINNLKAKYHLKNNSEVISKLLTEKDKPSKPFKSKPQTKKRLHLAVTTTDNKKIVYERIKKMRAEKLSFQQISNILNEENVPTFSGKGIWNKGSIGKLIKNTPTYLTS